MNDLMSDTAWIKANELVKEKYGKNLSYRAMKLVGPRDSQNEAGFFYNNGDDLVIPLKIKNLSLGDVIVDRGSLLDQQQKLEITDLVKFLVEPKIYSLQLKQSEDNLTKMTRSSLSLVEINPQVVELYHSDKVARKTLSQILLLKSHIELTRNKVALKIHEMTGRNLFVHLDDIIASLSSKEDLTSLTDMTIYVSDIELISSSTLQLLQDYLQEETEDGPLFLIGSSLTQESMEKMNWPDSLKKDLQGFYFDIDRVQLSQQTSEDILELLFFQLATVLS